MSIEKAITLLSDKSVSLESAAEIAEIDILDFIVLLQSKNIPWKEYMKDEPYFYEISLGDVSEKLGEKEND
ncbi:UPF0175 family protein [Clostridium sp. HMP27]|uniref:UPF0175 family protein n=1 Tax=Clostridium sp. HMP27 TaxID=1487921 RepID=UPI00052B7CCB|nr:UPF0175 family protein [Clostridium sp. HMP27]KGK86327.1 hypothetical protein DP68_14060 [Clostridium sp. HMP27]